METAPKKPPMKSSVLSLIHISKDVERRRSPYMVPWEELPDRAKEWNRSAVRSIPSLLASVNLAVVK